MSGWRNIPRFAVALTGFLERNVTKKMDILETGAGASTVWLARRAKSVLSYEHDPKWYTLVMSKLREEGLQNCELIHDLLYPERGINSNSRSFDIIIIDGRGRIKSMETSYHLLKSGGYLILDDAERTRYRAGRELLDGLGWERTELSTEDVKKSAIAWRKPE